MKKFFLMCCLTFWGVFVAQAQQKNSTIALPFALLETTTYEEYSQMRGLQSSILSRYDGKLFMTTNDTIRIALPNQNENLRLRWQYAKDAKTTKGKLVLRFEGAQGKSEIYEKIVDDLSAKNYQDTTFVLPKGLRSVSLAFRRTSKTGRIFLKEFQVAAPLEVTSAGYATFYSSAPIVVPQGLTAYTVTAHHAGKLTLKAVAQAGEVVPEGNAVLLQGMADNYLLEQPMTKDYKKIKQLYEQNMLLGSDTMRVVESDTHYLYKLANDPQRGLAFYWDIDLGERLQLQAYRAYLQIDRMQYPLVQSWAWDNLLTALSPLVSKRASSERVYNLSGQVQTVNAKGLVIVNGRKCWRY